MDTYNIDDYIIELEQKIITKEIQDEMRTKYFANKNKETIYLNYLKENGCIINETETIIN